MAFVFIKEYFHFEPYYIYNSSFSIIRSLSLDNAGDLFHEKKKESKMDVEYLYILLPYIKRFNSYCGLCIRNCSFDAQTDNHKQLLRCLLYCVGRPSCPFSSSVIVANSGVCHVIVTNGTIFHMRDKTICRPIREPIRSMIKKQFSHGATVYRVYQERLQRRNGEERQRFNYDSTGRSRNILAKIKSEQIQESILSSNIDEPISELSKKFQNDINPGW